MLATAITLAFALQGSTAAVSVAPSGMTGNSASIPGSVSSNGLHVAFHSYASDLVAGDGNGFPDVFLRDNAHQTTELLSSSYQGGASDGPSFAASVSADGRFVGFGSAASNLVPGDVNGALDSFLLDRATGQTSLVSVSSTGQQGNAGSSGSICSDDGTVVVFLSDATNLVPGDTNGYLDVFVHNMVTGQTARVSVDSSGNQGDRDSGLLGFGISGDGRFVTFTSAATNLAPNDQNGNFDVFVHDVLTGSTTLESVGFAGVSSNGQSFEPSISSDGQVISFISSSTDLIAGTVFNKARTYVKDRSTGLFLLASVNSQGLEDNGVSQAPRISDAGNRVVFSSTGTNLVPGDTNGIADFFVRDLSTATTIRVSVGDQGQEVTSLGSFPAISPDGGFVVFSSQSSNLVPGDQNGTWDVFMRDTECGQVSEYCTGKINSAGCLPTIFGIGTASYSAGGQPFTVQSTNVLNHSVGILIWSQSEAATPFGGGTLCLEPPIERTPGQFSGGSSGAPNCSGSYSFEFTAAYLQAQALVPGSAVYCQYWSRDNGFGAPQNIGLTPGLRFTVCQ